MEIRGVAAWDYSRLEVLASIGATAIRAGPQRRGLNEAWKRGLSVLVNLPSRGEMNGMDWDSPDAVLQQEKEICRIVRRLRHHPAVLLWSLGNELDHLPHAVGEYNPPHEEIWSHVNSLARAIKSVDPTRPVCVCTDMGDIENKIQDIARDCPDLDLVGLNCFRDTDKIVGLMKKYWKKPYIFTEWGPPPPWRTQRTSWGAPLELPSSKKAATISVRYENMIANNENCLGSFLFFWGDRIEITHTWFGLFRDGLKTEVIDVMKHRWTGTWPENRAPGVLGVSLEGQHVSSDVRLCPKTEYSASVVCFEPDGDEMSFSWEIRREAVRRPGAYAGHLEVHEDPRSGQILDQNEKQVRFQTPLEPGAYRLFVQVTDGKGSAGYANLPFLVEGAE